MSVRSQVWPALTATQPPAHPAGGSSFGSLEITSISVRFKGTELRPVLPELAVNRSRVVLVKDQGVQLIEVSPRLCRGDSQGFDLYDGRREVLISAKRKEVHDERV
jgi:hypothetical protein